MSTTRTSPAGPADPQRPDTTARLGDGRYLLGRTVSRRDGGDLREAHDDRLGRAVLVQYQQGVGHRGLATSRLATVTATGLAPVLDAGEERRGELTLGTYAVYPATDRPTLADLLRDDTGTLATAAAASIAAWLLATGVRLRAACGTTVALSSGAVMVDPAVTTGELPTDVCPVQWLPAPGARDDELPEVVARLGHHVDRRAGRRWAAAAASVADPHTQARAARMFAALAGFHPGLLELPSVTPHRAGPSRRSFDRRTLTGLVPATKRKDTACVSVEACCSSPSARS